MDSPTPSHMPAIVQASPLSTCQPHLTQVISPHNVVSPPIDESSGHISPKGTISSDSQLNNNSLLWTYPYLHLMLYLTKIAFLYDLIIDHIIVLI